MNILLIVGTFEALFLTILVMAMKNRTNADLFLGLIFLIDGLSIGFAYLQYFNLNNDFPYPWALNLGFTFLFLHGPALWLYIRALSLDGFSFKPVYLLHFMPFIIFFAIQYQTFVVLDFNEKIKIVTSESFKSQNFYKVAVLCIGLSTITYYLWGLKQISEHRKKLKHHFSRIDDKDLDWLRILIIASLITYGANALVFNLDLIFGFASFKLLMMGSYGFASIYILVMGFFGIRQGNVFIRLNEYNRESENEDLNINGDVKNINSEQIFADKLLEFMKQKQAYLDPEITLSGLASQLNVQTDYLSKVINGVLLINFFDFINTYRIEEFKIQALDDENNHLSIIGIAYNCGFNSKAAFYRAFKKNERISPGDYLKHHSRK